MIAGLFLLFAPAMAQGPAYLEDVDDLPLAPGLVEDPAARVAFDKPEGRIVQAAASGRTDAADVHAFYAQSLPALGWQPGADRTWVRDKELLRVRVEAKGETVIVRYTIAPNAP
ncbi:MAG: hypothetical protein CL566_05200 [Alphaproteobacteria bacterium]|nr:hypothetical protein [Alphaproteobacteria bacterium]